MSAARRPVWSFALQFALSTAVVSTVYFMSSLVVFDYRDTAWPQGEEEFNGRRVAFGPRPYYLFCRPYYGNGSYSGDEWPFFAFRPVCFVWRLVKNYEAPGEGDRSGSSSCGVGRVWPAYEGETVSDGRGAMGWGLRRFRAAAAGSLAPLPHLR